MIACAGAGYRRGLAKALGGLESRRPPRAHSGLAVPPASLSPVLRSGGQRQLAGGGAAGGRLPVPDGGRTDADNALGVRNRKRVLGAWLVDPDEGFAKADYVLPDASAQEQYFADTLFRGALQRVQRANLASKDSRVQTAMNKWEQLVEACPPLCNLRKLRFEGDLDTSDLNEKVLLIAAEFFRRAPKNAAGDLIKGDTVGDSVSALKVAAEEHYGRKVLCASGGLMLKLALQNMRREDGPSGGRALSAPLRQQHLQELAQDSCPFDILGEGWPRVRWALMQAMHQALMRGGEPGRTPRQPFRPALGICWRHLVWLDPATLMPATVRVGAHLHDLLVMFVRPIKDQKGRHKRVPIPIISKHPTGWCGLDLTCPYTALARSWEDRVGDKPWASLADEPFFVAPDGLAVTTDTVSAAIRLAALALRLQPGVFNASALRRGGATDLRAKLGTVGGKQLIVQRGRWCETDVDDIYSRASLEEHAGASLALTSAEGQSLEQAAPGWVQPTHFGR